MKRFLPGLLACLSVGALMLTGTCQAQDEAAGVIRITDSVQVGAQAQAQGARVDHVDVSKLHPNVTLTSCLLFKNHCNDGCGVNDQCAPVCCDPCGDSCGDACGEASCCGNDCVGSCCSRWTDKLRGWFGGGDDCEECEEWDECDDCEDCDDCDDGCCFLSCLHRNGPCDGCALGGCYHRVYAVNPNHFDSRDGRLYSAQGYGIPVTVPLAPNVRHAYNYGWGIPSSRLTPISQPMPGYTGR